MRRAIIGGLAVAGLMGAGLALAHTTSTPTELGFRTSVGTQESNELVGVLESNAERCLRGRKVVLWRIEPDDTRTRLDVDRTSRGGAWAVVGDFTGAIDGRVKVLRENVGGRQHRHICEAQVLAD